MRTTEQVAPAAITPASLRLLKVHSGTSESWAGRWNLPWDWNPAGLSLVVVGEIIADHAALYGSQSARQSLEAFYWESLGFAS
jgi:hypothetical protein